MNTSQIKEAEEQGQWLWNRYHDVWFSPNELRQRQGEGRFMWGPDNWEIRNPAERILQFQGQIILIQARIRNFEARIKREAKVT